jgi:hypothetical protein
LFRILRSVDCATQRRHELEGAPDPFPSFGEANATQAKVKAAATADLDTRSETAFPSLAPSTSTPAAPTTSAWGGPRIRPAVPKQPVFSDSITLSAIDLSNVGRDGKQATLGEIMKQVTTKYKVKLEASPNQKTRQTTFFLKADSEKDLEKAKRSLVALLSPVVRNRVNGCLFRVFAELVLRRLLWLSMPLLLRSRRSSGLEVSQLRRIV